MTDMAYESMWYKTQIPDEMIDILVKDLENRDESFEEARTKSGIDLEKRDSDVTWISQNHWIGGFLWHYITRGNRENFCYDLTCIDGESIQYTQYGEGQFYDWHIDAGIDTSYKPQLIASSGTNLSQDQVTLNGEYVRKLSFALQLSDAEDYTGGEVQFLDNGRNTYFAPKQRGTLMLFDSRTPHRVRKVKSGMRKSLVGWVVGPRWR